MRSTSWGTAIAYFLGVAILVFFVQDLPKTDAWWAPLFIAPIALTLWLLQVTGGFPYDFTETKLFIGFFVFIGVLGLAYLVIFYISA